MGWLGSSSWGVLRGALRKKESSSWFGKGRGWSPGLEERTLESTTEKLTSRDSDVSTSSASPGPPVQLEVPLGSLPAPKLCA